MECGDSQAHQKQKINLRRWVYLIEFITSLADLQISGSLGKKRSIIGIQIICLGHCKC